MQGHGGAIRGGSAPREAGEASTAFAAATRTPAPALQHAGGAAGGGETVCSARFARRVPAMLLRLVALLSVVLVAACATSAGSRDKLNSALYTYQSTIRWGDLSGAMAFIDPALRESLQPTPLQQQRMQQLQVTGYYVQGSEQTAEDELRQVVEIRVVNKHTQVERSIIDRQVWKWSRKDDAWWLTSGLPDFSPR
jgi:hypothetical protein